MNHLKKLAGQTVVYGFSTIVTRFLNYLLTPFYTYIFINPEAFGDVTILYAYVALLNIVLTYGMETGMFYFARKEDDFSKVYGTAFYSLLVSTVFFLVFSLVFLNRISEFIDYGDKSRYVLWFILILGFDTLSAIPFAKLRQKNKAFKFAFIKLLNVLITIFLNILLIWFIPKFLVKDGTFLGFEYQVTIEFIFISNFLGSISTFILLMPEIAKEKMRFSWTLWKEMFRYSYPLLFVGLIGFMNETFDRIMLQQLLPDNVNVKAQIGVYGAAARLAMLMAIFTQMFRFAAEPFFFNQHKGEDQRVILAEVSKYFFLFGLIIFLGVLAYIDIFQYFLGSTYRSGLDVVPVYLLGSLGLGVYYNLSFWYKLTGKTHFGIWITAIGAFITVAINFLYIPEFGYHASAWARLICYSVIVVISYLLGQKFYPVNYDLWPIVKYFVVALLCFGLIYYLPIDNTLMNLIKNTLVFVSFIAILEYKEKIITTFIKR